MVNVKVYITICKSPDMTTLEDIMEWSDTPIHGVSATNKDP